MLIRIYRPTDAAAIAQIYNQAITVGNSTFDCHPKSAQEVARTVANFGDREVMLVGEIDAKVMGWGSIKAYSDRPGYRVCCETSIYMALTKTGQGYGSLLQRALLEKVAQLQYHHVVVKIMASNQKSVAFHRRFGFEVVGVQKEIGYMNQRWHDIVLMQLVLPEVPPYQPELG